MDIIEIRLLSTLGILVVGVLTTAGAITLSVLAAGVVQAGFAIGGWLRRLRTPATGSTGPMGASPIASAMGPRLHGPAGDHALLARQAWWRLRC
jgi:hypothetical protein